jgi:Mat/Ecp fimbriae major subunit
MTNRFMKAALAGTVFAAAFASTGAQAATATATAKAEILQQVTVTKNTDLDYAVIASGCPHLRRRPGLHRHGYSS